MRASSHPLLGVAFLVFVGPSGALAQGAAPDPVPVFDVGITAGRCIPSSVELLGRTSAPGSICVSVSAGEFGAHVIYFQPVSFVLDPDGAERATREVAGLNFSISARSSSRSHIVHAELLISSGPSVIAHYRSATILPLTGRVPH